MLALSSPRSGTARSRSSEDGILAETVAFGWRGRDRSSRDLFGARAGERGTQSGRVGVGARGGVGSLAHARIEAPCAETGNGGFGVLKVSGLDDREERGERALVALQPERAQRGGAFARAGRGLKVL